MKKFILFFCAAFIATLGMFADSVVLSHAAGGSTINLTGENDAAQFGLNAAEWSVVSDLTTGDNPKRVGLHRDGYIVLYNDNHLTISNLKGKVITSIVLDVHSGSSEVFVNGQAVAGVDNVYEVGADEVVLHNPDGSKLNLNSITVNYETPVVEGAVTATITAVFPNGNKHVVYSNGEKLTAGAEVPADAVAKFDVVSRTENTLVLKAGDQYIHWTSGDDPGKSPDLDGLSEEFDEALNTLTLAPANFAGALTASKNDWNQSQETVEGLYQIKGYGTNNRLFDFTLREFDDAWIAGDPGNYFFDTNWDGNGCRTSFFEIVFEEEAPAVEPVLSADDVHAKHSYYIYTDARGGLTINSEDATELRGTIEDKMEPQEVDPTNPLQQFAFVNYQGDLYLYSVGAHKFVNAAKKGILEDTPKTPILFKEAGEDDVMLYFDDAHNINLGGSKQVTIDTWSDKDPGNSFHIMLADSFDPAPVLAALEEAKSGSAEVTYNYTIGGRVWKTVVSEQTKGETVAAPAEQPFANIVSYNEDVVAEGLVVTVVCEEALPFTTSTEAKPVYGYLRGHSNQIRYAYVNEEGVGMDTGNLEEEMTEFEDNYLWFISGNLIDGFELHNKAYGVLRATEGQTSVNGDANSVWQLRAGSAGTKLTENVFAFWAEGVNYINCQTGLKYWTANDAGSTFTFTVVEAVEPEPVVKSNEFVTEGKLYTLTAVTKAGEEYAWTVQNGEVVPVLNGTPAKFVCEFHGDDVAFVTEDGKYLRNHDCTPSNATWYTDKSATGISDEYNELCNLVFEHFPATAANVDAGFGDFTADLVAIKAARGHRTDNGLIADGYFIMNSDGTFSGAATTAPFFKDGYTSAFRLAEYVEPETFPAAGVAYKIKNVDAALYLNVIDNVAAGNNNGTVLGNSPMKLYFEAVDGGYYIKNEAGLYVGGHTNTWSMSSAVPEVWTIEEAENGTYKLHSATGGNAGYLGFDDVYAGAAAFRDKGADKHWLHNIWKFDEEEPQPIVPDATLEETWENIKTLLAEAEAIKALNEVTVTYDGDGYFEDFVSPIVGKVGYKTHDVVWAVCDGADYVNSFVTYYTSADECEADLADWGGIAALEEILKNVIADYNEAEVVLPEAGKTYIIRNQPYTYSDDYSYAFYLDGQNLSTTQCVNATEAKHMWTCAGSSTYTYFNADLDAVSDVRYQFYNAEDNSQYFAWKRVDTDATKADTKWYLTGKNLDGTASPVYGTIAMHTYADNNQYRLLVIDMRNGAQQHANGHCWGNTYSDWYWFEEVEIPVTEWDGNAPVVEVADETTVKVTFTDAHSVEGTNYGVLGAIFDESGDVVSVLFDALFDNAVEYDKDSATLHFKKIAELNAELAASAKNVAAKALRAVGGEAKGKVVICGKSFKIDGATIYQDAIVADFSFGGTQTGIDAATLAGQNNIFDLNGRRVREAKNGLFLQNGKKVVK